MASSGSNKDLLVAPNHIEQVNDTLADPTGEVRQSSIKEIFTEAEVSSRALTKRGTWLSRQRLKETFYSHNELNLHGRCFSHW